MASGVAGVPTEGSMTGDERERLRGRWAAATWGMLVPAMDRVRLAIVGSGNIVQLNAHGYLRHPRCDVTVLCDPIGERAESRARQWGLTLRICAGYAPVLDNLE